MSFLGDVGGIVGSFLTEIVGGAAVRARAAETDIKDAAPRIAEAADAVRSWAATDLAKVLVAADPLSLIKRGDAGRLYLGIAAAIIQATPTGSRSAKDIRRGLEAGIDGLPRDVRIFTKRGAVKTLSTSLAEVAERLA